jgi:ABC-type nickel/cobalt efflux system permease component RcnA
MESDTSVLVHVLQALSVAIIGGLGAYIAWRQWRTAHDKVKLDLFDRRLAAYQRLKDAVAPITASGKVTLADTDRFARAMYDMRFLFDKETETASSWTLPPPRGSISSTAPRVLCCTLVRHHAGGRA